MEQKKLNKQKKYKYNNKNIEHLDNNSTNQSDKKKKSSLNDDFFAAKNKKKLEEIEKLQNMSEMESKYSQNDPRINISLSKPLYDLTIYELYQNCKKTWQDIIVEFDMSKIKSYEYLLLFFGIKNRRFYFGISLIIIGLILYIFDTLLIN